MKTTISLLLILISSLTIFGQVVPCKLKYETFPALRGLKIDMPKSEVTKLYPAMSAVSKDGINLGIVKGSEIQNAEYKNGVESLVVMLYEEKVFSVMVNYDSSIKWSSGKEFADKISETLGLPLVSWTAPDSTSRTMFCEDFIVSAGLSKVGNAQIMVTRPPEEIKTPNQNKKETFKP